jgi:hypothetical protein
VSDIVRVWDSGARELVRLVEKGRKKREKKVEASGAAKDICRNSGGDVLDKKWGCRRQWMRVFLQVMAICGLKGEYEYSWRSQ